MKMCSLRVRVEREEDALRGEQEEEEVKETAVEGKEGKSRDKRHSLGSSS